MHDPDVQLVVSPPVPELELVLVVAGRMSIAIGDGQAQLSAATLCWTFPHRTPVPMLLGPAARGSRDLDGWLVRADRALLELVDRADPPPEYQHWQRARRGVVARVSAKNQRWLYDRLAELSQLPAKSAATGTGLAYVLIRAWEMSVATPPPDQPGSTTVLAASKILKDPHRSDNRSTKSLARAIGVSPGHLERRFRAETGTTITQFRLQAQIERYLDLCDDDHSLTITDAAYRAGFGSYAQFHRVFQRYLGLSPSLHRANRRRAQNDSAQTSPVRGPDDAAAGTRRTDMVTEL